MTKKALSRDAGQFLRKFGKENDVSEPIALILLFVQLHHWAQQRRIDFYGALDEAYNAYLEEKNSCSNTESEVV